MLPNIHNKQPRKKKSVSWIISNYNAIKQTPGFYNLPPYLVKLLFQS